MLRRSLVGVYLLFLTTLPGCMATLARSDGATQDEFRPLKATRSSVKMFAETTKGVVTGRDEHGPIDTEDRLLGYPLVGALTLIDTPASVASDVLCLPTDIAHEVKRSKKSD